MALPTFSRFSSIKFDRLGDQRDVRRLALVGLVLVLLLVFLFLPIRLPYDITAQGQVLPLHTWMLIRDTNGMTSLLVDNALGRTETFAVAQIDREDGVRFSVRPEVRTAAYVQTGDTLGTATSSLMERQLAGLRSNLLTERATLSLFQSGEKASVVEEARNRLAYAEEQVAAQRLIVERLRELNQSNAASVEELQIAESQLALNQRQVEIARAALQTVSTGAKQEQLDLVRARIAALESDIAALERRLEDFTIISPVSGLLLNTASMDTLMVVADTSAFVVVMSIRWGDRRFVAPDQPVTFSGLQRSESGSARVLRIDRHARFISGQQVILANALVDPEAGAAMIPGMLTRCTIASEPVTPLEYVRRFTGRLMKS